MYTLKKKIQDYLGLIPKSINLSSVIVCLWLSASQQCSISPLEV